MSVTNSLSLASPNGTSPRLTPPLAGGLSRTTTLYITSGTESFAWQTLVRPASMTALATGTARSGTRIRSSTNTSTTTKSTLEGYYRQLEEDARVKRKAIIIVTVVLVGVFVGTVLGCWLCCRYSPGGKRRRAARKRRRADRERWNANPISSSDVGEPIMSQHTPANASYLEMRGCQTCVERFNSTPLGARGANDSIGRAFGCTCPVPTSNRPSSLGVGGNTDDLSPVWRDELEAAYRAEIVAAEAALEEHRQTMLRHQERRRTQADTGGGTASVMRAAMDEARRHAELSAELATLRTRAAERTAQINSADARSRAEGGYVRSSFARAVGERTFTRTFSGSGMPGTPTSTATYQPVPIEPERRSSTVYRNARDPEAGVQDAAPAYVQEADGGEVVIEQAAPEGPPEYRVKDEPEEGESGRRGSRP